MKLKQKLSIEYALSDESIKDFTNGMNFRRRDFITNAYLAGFEKARELITEMLGEYSYLSDDEDATVTEGRGIMYRAKYLGEQSVGDE